MLIGIRNIGEFQDLHEQIKENLNGLLNIFIQLFGTLFSLFSHPIGQTSVCPLQLYIHFFVSIVWEKNIYAGGRDKR